MATEKNLPHSAAEMLLEIERIKFMKAGYLRYLDTKQWVKWRSLLTDDLEALYDDGSGAPPVVLARSADELVDSISRRMADAVSIHHAHSPEIELTSPTTATAYWALSDVVQRPTTAVNPSVVGMGYYRDEYRRGEDAQWRVARFHITRLYMAPVHLASLARG